MACDVCGEGQDEHGHARTGTDQGGLSRSAWFLGYKAVLGLKDAILYRCF
jgi:hypothetical protein